MPTGRVTPSASRRRPALGAADPDPDHPPRGLQVDQPRADDGRGRVEGPGQHLGSRERTQDPDQVGDVLVVAGPAAFGKVLQRGFRGGDGRRIEQVAKRQAGALPEQFRQQGRVE
jgi:hypothetical protein